MSHSEADCVGVKRRRIRLRQIGEIVLAVSPLATSAALTIVLYGASLSYGFMFDDPFDLPRASARSYFSILTDAGESPYYRPLVLMIWKALHDLLGRHDGQTLHLLVLASHVVNGWLVYHIAARLQGRIGGYLSALLFVSFPLSYQAIAYVNAFFHPLVTTFILSSVVLYWHWRDGGERHWLGFAAFTALLGVFAHEYGVLVAILILLAESQRPLSGGIQRLSVAPAMFSGISIGFLLLWWTMPRWKTEWQLDAASLQQSALYFFQGFVYPVASRLADWTAGLGLSGGELLILSGGPVVALIAVVHIFSARRQSLVFALCWTAVGVVPALVSLPFSYILDGPRLFYLSSVGIALAWGGMASATFSLHDRVTRAACSSLSIALAALIVLQSAIFIQDRHRLFVEGSKIVRSLAATASDARRAGRTYVNFPSWFALKRPDFLLGHTGVVMVPAYIGLGRVAYLHTGQQAEIVSLGYDATARQFDYYYAPHGEKAGLEELEKAFRRGGGVYATAFYSRSLELEYVGTLTGQMVSTNTSYAADFEGRVRLTSAQLEPGPRGVDLTLQWLALERPERDYTIFAHVYDARGKLVAQADGYPIGQMFPLQRWRAGDFIEDRRRIDLPLAIQPGTYRVVVGIYDRQTGQRVIARDAEGARYRDDGVAVGEVTVGPGAEAGE